MNRLIFGLCIIINTSLIGRNTESIMVLLHYIYARPFCSVRCHRNEGRKIHVDFIAPNAYCNSYSTVNSTRSLRDWGIRMQVFIGKQDYVFHKAKLGLVLEVSSD